MREMKASRWRYKFIVKVFTRHTLLTMVNLNDAQFIMFGLRVHATYGFMFSNKGCFKIVFVFYCTVEVYCICIHL